MFMNVIVNTPAVLSPRLKKKKKKYDQGLYTVLSIDYRYPNDFLFEGTWALLFFLSALYGRL